MYFFDLSQISDVIAKNLFHVVVTCTARRARLLANDGPFYDVGGRGEVTDQDTKIGEPRQQIRSQHRAGCATTTVSKIDTSRHLRQRMVEKRQ